MKPIWTSQLARTTSTYAEHAPTAAVCCNACRTCVTTNIVGLALTAAAGAGYAVARLARTLVRTKP